MLQKVKESYELVQVRFIQEDIDRAHRNGMAYKEKNSGIKVKSIIVKFKFWRAQKHDARPKSFIYGKKKPECKSFSVSTDLTKRHLLLCVARKSIKNNYDIGDNDDINDDIII